MLKPNEAMIAEAAVLHQTGVGRLGPIDAFAPTLESMLPEFPADAQPALALAAGALEALNAGDGATYDALIAASGKHLHELGSTAIALAQFSMARARAACEAAAGLPVLTTVDASVRTVRQRLQNTHM